MRILILEDDKKIADFVSNGLKQAGYAVDVIDDGEMGLQFGLNNAYDAAVIDIMLPGCDGLSVIEQWRKARITTSVIILSAKDSVDDRVRGLQAGGDDYLTKPFAFSELLARVQALIRRSTHTSEPTVLNCSDLSLESAHPGGDAWWQEDRAPLARIFVARIHAAPSRTRAFKDDDPGARLGLRIRSENECRRCAGLPTAEQNRPGVRSQAHPHTARFRLCPQAGLRGSDALSVFGCMCGSYWC